MPTSEDKLEEEVFVKPEEKARCPAKTTEWSSSPEEVQRSREDCIDSLRAEANFLRGFNCFRPERAPAAGSARAPSDRQLSDVPKARESLKRLRMCFEDVAVNAAALHYPWDILREALKAFLRMTLIDFKESACTAPQKLSNADEADSFAARWFRPTRHDDSDSDDETFRRSTSYGKGNEPCKEQWLPGRHTLESYAAALGGCLDELRSPPFTVQRLCELLLEPTRCYTKLWKLCYALERLVVVGQAASMGSTKLTTVCSTSEAERGAGDRISRSPPCATTSSSRTALIPPLPPTSRLLGSGESATVPWESRAARKRKAGCHDIPSDGTSPSEDPPMSSGHNDDSDHTISPDIGGMASDSAAESEDADLTISWRSPDGKYPSQSPSDWQSIQQMQRLKRYESAGGLFNTSPDSAATDDSSRDGDLPSGAHIHRTTGHANSSPSPPSPSSALPRPITGILPSSHTLISPSTSSPPSQHAAPVGR